MAVVHPLLPSHPLSEVAPGRRADECVRSKQAHYAAQCSLAGWGFWGLGFETTGAWSASVASFVRNWARLLGMSTGIPAPQCSAALAWALSAVQAKAVGGQLLRGLGRARPGVPSLAEASSPVALAAAADGDAAGARVLLYTDPDNGIRVWARRAHSGAQALAGDAGGGAASQ